MPNWTDRYRINWARLTVFTVLCAIAYGLSALADWWGHYWFP